ncbi:MAG: hypothetical protein AAGF27_05105 [Pseudomonadota bacterium]
MDPIDWITHAFGPAVMFLLRLDEATIAIVIIAIVCLVARRDRNRRQDGQADGGSSGLGGGFGGDGGCDGGGGGD